MEDQKVYEVVKRDEYQISAEDVRKFIAPNATDKELFMFMGIIKSYGLNPLKREIHFVKYGNNAASIIVGYETYLKRAERTGKLDGWKAWIENDNIGEKACIEIKRKDQSFPIRWEVYRSEFDKGQSTRKTMPTFMLKKVAIAQGFRLAFPDDLGGMPYIPEEMPESKGGGTSEMLPLTPVEVRENDTPVLTNEEEDVPDFPDEPPEMVPEENTINGAQGKRLFAIAKTAGWTNEKLKEYLIEAYNIDSSKKILVSKYDAIIDRLQKGM